MPNPRDEFARTTCACSKCLAACQSMPGMLIPGDVERIADLLQIPPEDRAVWALDHFQASEGALVAQAGRAFRIPTVVPAARPDGSCIFLTSDGRCGVHAQSPFGCAYNDMHQDAATGNRVSAAGLRAIAADFAQGGDYGQLHMALSATGRTALPLAQRRAHLAGRVAAIEANGG